MVNILKSIDIVIFKEYRCPYCESSITIPFREDKNLTAIQSCWACGKIFAINNDIIYREEEIESKYNPTKRIQEKEKKWKKKGMGRLTS